MLDSYDLLSKIDSTYDIEELSRLELLLLQSKLTEKIKDSFTKPGGFMNFVRHFWSSVEPEKEMKQGWILEAIGEHLEACIDGRITRLLINVPPGSSKSLLCSVFLPAYIWGPMNYPSARILNISYSASLPMRDNRRMLRLIRSPEYQKMYGDLFKLTKDGEILIENNCSGFKNGLGISGGVTGNRCDFLICDDLNNITAKETKDVMDETNRKFIEGVSNRLNDMVESVIIVIAQRCHQNDVSGFIIKSEFYEDYVHLCIPFLLKEEYVKLRLVGQIQE